MKVPTPGNLAAWEEAYKRWKILTTLVARPVDDQIISEEMLKKKVVIPKIAMSGQTSQPNVTYTEVKY